MTRRSLFKTLGAIVATVALAPEIAFGRLKMPGVEKFVFNATDYMGENEFITVKRIQFSADWIGNPYTEDELMNTPFRPYSELQRLRKEAGL